MAGSKRDRQRASRQARMAAAAEARRRAERRRNALAGGLILVVVVLIAVVVLIVTRSDKSKPVAVQSPSTTAQSSPSPTPTQTPTTVATSAAGRPCVAPVGPYPAGAPQVPVKLGSPPGQLVTEDIKAGAGATVTTGQTVTVNYIGVSCSTGKIFDASYGKQPATFPLGNVIPGWQQGIPGMKVGGQRLLGIPPALAYGATGSPPSIAPNETLWFVVEMIKAA